jgi:hypothetical protein
MGTITTTRVLVRKKPLRGGGKRRAREYGFPGLDPVVEGIGASSRAGIKWRNSAGFGA